MNYSFDSVMNYIFMYIVKKSLDTLKESAFYICYPLHIYIQSFHIFLDLPFLFYPLGFVSKTLPINLSSCNHNTLHVPTISSDSSLLVLLTESSKVDDFSLYPFWGFFNASNEPHLNSADTCLL